MCGRKGLILDLVIFTNPSSRAGYDIRSNFNCFSIFKRYSGLCIYNLFVWSNFNFLNISPWIPFLTLRAVLNKSWRQHPTRLQPYEHLPPITKTIQVRRTRHAGHCWRSKDELISDVLLWTPTYGCAKVGRPARTYIQQLCEDTGCNPEDLPEAMNDREKWRERVRDIRAGSATWWWWWWYYFAIIKYIRIICDWSFRLYHHRTGTYYFVASHQFSLQHNWSSWHCFVLWMKEVLFLS